MSERFSNNTRSSNFQYGEPPSHILAKELTANYLRKFNLFAIFEYPISVWNGESELVSKRQESYQHNYDVALFCVGDYIINSQNQKIFLMTFQHMRAKDLIKNRFKKIIDKKVKLIVEVDDPDLHSTKIHKINDGVAQSFAEEQMPQANFCRLNKWRIVTPELVQNEEMNDYLKRYLEPHIPIKRI